MKFKKLISIIVSAVLAAQVLPVAATAADAAWDAPLSISAAENPMPEGNLLSLSTFDREACLRRWDAGVQKLRYVEDENGGYLRTDEIHLSYSGFTYGMVYEIPAGMYKFTGWFRTANKGEISYLRILFNTMDGETIRRNVYINNEWFKVETYITTTDYLSDIKVLGGPNFEFVQEYCMDNFSLVAVDEIPEGGVKIDYGTKVTPDEAIASMGDLDYVPWNPNEEYEVKGLMINHDNSNYFSQIAENELTEQDYIDFTKNFEGTHVTDYVINVDGVFPAPGTGRTSALEYYHMTEFFGGEEADFKEGTTTQSAHYMYDILSSDYIGAWIEGFREIGINPWISFRMNDIHNLSDGVHTAISEFRYKNPQFARVQHHEKQGNWELAYDYTHPEVREHMLSYINAALNRFDPYGIELDFQREIKLWFIGGEYDGLEILNDFMRRVEELVAVYEEKYEHEIKIGVRVGPDIQSNYEFGLDVVTWAAEGIVDLVSPTGRYESHNNDMPIRLWKSVLSPFNVELAPCIETANLRSYAGAPTGGHDIETLAGTAANMFSQGADKMYTYNYFLNATTAFGEEDKITTDDTFFGIGTTRGFWNVITSIGSYEKVITMDRRVIVTYNDVKPDWQAKHDGQLPAAVSKGGDATGLRIPVGDITEGSVLTLKFSTDKEEVLENPPKVFVNSKLCKYIGYGECDGVYTSDDVLEYEIPVEAHGNTYVVAEIFSDVAFTINFAEVHIET
ncbi:MAG: hypothetical protein IJY93_06165 [Clostridia bacterium]|nr:hypothetical protein [Clostridia bacterium]